jgi:serine/threonine protein kinase
MRTSTKPGGTIRWEAPELMDDHEDGDTPKTTFKSDIYSMASVMYEVREAHAPSVSPHKS